MTETKIIKAVFGGTRSTVTQPRYRYDYGQILEVSGITLPESFEARFSNAPTGASVRVLGSNQRVAVPDDLMRTGKSVWCYITVHDAVTDGRTMYSIRIPIRDATERTDAEPTPVQHDIISQAIATLNNAVERTSADVETTTQKATEASESATASAQSATASANNAEQSAQRAVESAQSANQSAVSANQSAQSASASAQSASASAESATASANSASQSAQSADRAEQAANTAGYLDVEIVNGRLIYSRTDAVDVDFRLTDGHLIMEAV